MTALDKLRELSQLFDKQGITDPAREASILLTAALDISNARLHSDPPLIEDKISIKLDSLATRRIHGEPLQYIIGHVDFWGMRIHVGAGVLIPRPETELLVEEAIKVMMDAGTERQGDRRDKKKQIEILDLCTGSGCIALALAKEFPQSDVYGIDRSAKALDYAKKNAESNGIRNVTFIEGDLFAPVSEDARFDCIVSNPPYIRTGDISGLQREIDFEPADALDGGLDGLDFYRRILKDASRYLKDNGPVIMEIGFDQAEDIRKLASNDGFRHIRFMKDYAGIDRIFAGRL